MDSDQAIHVITDKDLGQEHLANTRLVAAMCLSALRMIELANQNHSYRNQAKHHKDRQGIPSSQK